MEPEYISLVKETGIYKNCTNIVIGKGNENADILFVGEAPGRNEDEQGLPFVGRAGKNLDALLEKVGLSLEDIYIANILKCRPPENRDPLPEEIRAHTPWLLEQIKQIKPKIVCSLGNYATKFFLSEGNVEEMKNKPGITSVHGKVKFVEIEGVKIKLIPLFHPAAIIYKRDLLPLWEEDMEIVKREIASAIELGIERKKEIKNSSQLSASELGIERKREIASAIELGIERKKEIIEKSEAKANKVQKTLI